MCGKALLISEELKDRLTWDASFEVQMVDTIRLKGKKREVRLYSVDDHAQTGVQ